MKLNVIKCRKKTLTNKMLELEYRVRRGLASLNTKQIKIRKYRQTNKHENQTME